MKFHNVPSCIVNQIRVQVIQRKQTWNDQYTGNDLTKALHDKVLIYMCTVYYKNLTTKSGNIYIYILYKKYGCVRNNREYKIMQTEGILYYIACYLQTNIVLMFVSWPQHYNTKRILCTSNMSENIPWKYKLVRWMLK